MIRLNNYLLGHIPVIQKTNPEKLNQYVAWVRDLQKSIVLQVSLTEFLQSLAPNTTQEFSGFQKEVEALAKKITDDCRANGVRNGLFTAAIATILMHANDNRGEFLEGKLESFLAAEIKKSEKNQTSDFVN